MMGKRVQRIGGCVLMDKKIVLVTGGTGGIGTAICRELSKNYRVIACYFKNGNHKLARDWQKAEQNQGFDIDVVYGDIASFGDCEKLISLVVEKHGTIHSLVNNAGITQDAVFKKMTETQWHQVIDANLNSVFNMTRLVIPHMIEQGYGRVVSISSINGRKGQFGQCNYAATKSALFGFTKSLAQEVARHQITVNTVSPGYIETPMLQKMNEDTLERIKQNIPIGRLGRPDEVAKSVKYLLSDDASFITGANLDINGGQYM